MNKQELKNRSEISPEFKWDIEAMYSDDELVKADFERSLKLSEEINAMQGHVCDSAEALLAALDKYSECMQLLERAFVYSHMKHDEDNSDPIYTELNSIAMSYIARVSAACSFLTPEILDCDESTVRAYISDTEGLSVYKFMIEQILEEKAHCLSKEEEFIMSTLSEVSNAPDEIFSALNDVDLDFGDIKGADGEPVKLTHSSYIRLMQDESREVRKDAYTALYEQYKAHNNTISVCYNYNVKHDVIISRLRKYDSCLHAALAGNKIPLSVYDNLISAVHRYLPAMHKYVEIRKRALNLDELTMYDVYRPLSKPADLKFTYDEAVDTVCKALRPLGTEYVDTIRKGITTDRWVDIYENKNKTSGAYSFGSYDSYPYILMNFDGELQDVFTLIHEGGHSMHSHYTRKTQPFIYGDHSIFTAEVASTVNETLLIHYLLEECRDDDMRKYLINFYIDEFKSTLIRQTMFAEFEKLAHEAVENGGSLTAEFLNSEYKKLNFEYFGPAVADDDLIQYEWSRIPHFYRSFYVYQYATGYSAANAIAQRILTGGEEAREDYIRFLSSGSSDYPIELLKIAGVDMSTEQPVISALETFSRLVDELDKLV